MEYIKKDLYNPHKDSTYQAPIIDCREERLRTVIGREEVPYLYIHGYFDGTNVKFMYAFPKKESYQGRFFQHLSPFPGPDEEVAALNKTGEDDPMAFSLTHGACYVESNMGSAEVFGGMEDSTIIYKSSAAVAEYCRTVAQELYGEHCVIGVVFGGSGGGYKTMSCIENTTAWDAAVPYVIGSPMSLPNCLTVPAHGSRILRHSWQKVVDALEPGGSGDIYAGLNEEEREALHEIVQMGFPPRMCVSFASNDDGSLPVLMPGVKEMDPTYFSDYWEVPGYLGADPQGSGLRDRVCMHTKLVAAGLLSDEDRDCMTILSTDEAVQEDTSDLQNLTEQTVCVQTDGNEECSDSQNAALSSILSNDEDCGVSNNTDKDQNTNSIDDRNGTDSAWQKMMADAGDVYIEVEDVPEGDDLFLRGVDIIFESGAAKGKRLRLDHIEGKRLIPGVSYGSDDYREVLSLVQQGDEVFLDNSDYIAIQTYHRHQVPEDTSFHAWDQYRLADGRPAIPQRPYVIAYDFTCGGCGSVQNGEIQGKVIVMNSLMDSDFPWQADWYRNKVESIYGEQSPETFRVYYNDNCPHGDVAEMEDDGRLVSYLGMLQQALLDAADWAEGIREPYANTGYDLVENQVILKADVAERNGIQPMVKLYVNGSECATIKVGEEVTFTAKVQLPKGAGEFEYAEWSFGEESEDVQAAVTDDKQSIQIGEENGYGCAEVTTTHCFKKPGTYFPVVRVISNRHPGDAYTRLRNLCRARVIVAE